jgi:hypothetical protein
MDGSCSSAAVTCRWRWISKQRRVFVPGQERALSGGVYNWRTEAGTNYAVDNKTERFLVIVPPSSADPEAKRAVRVIANWK